MSWITEVVDSCEENEAPPRFFYWAAISAISAVVKKQVWIDRHFYHLYPNTYVFLVAKSGMKKGVPINVARKLVEKVDATRIISGRNSMPQVLKDLSKAFTLESGGMIKDAQAFLLSGELAAFFVKDPDALTVLTDLHDTYAYEKFWTNSLKGTGIDKLIKPCITLLGATNEDHFSDAVPLNAIGGGFIARTFIVFSLERGKLNSLTEKPKKIVDIDGLSKYLKVISQVNGEFVWTDASKKTYDIWYYKFMGSEGTDSTGTNNRIGDQIIKVAMILSLAESTNLILKESHVIEAIDVCTTCISGMRQVTMGAGKSNLAMATRLVMRELIINKDHKMTKEKLLQKYWGEFDSFDLDRVCETLVNSGAVMLDQNAGRKQVLTMQKEALDIFTKAVREIQ